MKKTLAALILTLLLISGPAGAASRTVSMDLVHADLVSVLRNLTGRMGMNLVVDPTVHGEVTMTLKDVSAEKALNLVMAVSGFSYKTVDHTVVVGSHETLARLDADALDPHRWTGPVKTMVILLEYAKPQGIVDTVKGLYPGLDIMVGPNNSVVLRGPSDELREVHKLIKGD